MADIARASTLPPKLEPGSPSMISGNELKDLMKILGHVKMLLLDIRSSQSFTQSRIEGALNLCIPTTLLKRATFNLQKLQQTFQGNMDSEQFSKWRDMEWIVVYDAHASDKRDAVTAQNMIKKFTNEGYQGKTAILRGGFTLFSKSFPELVDTSSNSQTHAKNSTRNLNRCTLAPVIGGVNLPTFNNDHNPFFSNIRQNVELADGVGQFELGRPRDLESPLLPSWLRDASSQSDHGKKVSNKFLNIELDEQSRMRTAYAAFNPNQKSQDCKFRLSGVEKGTKNRYKDILPFEHARVRLQDTRNRSCDYVNASHLSASRSNKRYIATQGPLPATFEVRASTCPCSCIVHNFSFFSRLETVC
jgi:protein-tyrosine phosphatase